MMKMNPSIFSFAPPPSPPLHRLLPHHHHHHHHSIHPHLHPHRHRQPPPPLLLYPLRPHHRRLCLIQSILRRRQPKDRRRLEVRHASQLLKVYPRIRVQPRHHHRIPHILRPRLRIPEPLHILIRLSHQLLRISQLRIRLSQVRESISNNHFNHNKNTIIYKNKKSVKKKEGVKGKKKWRKKKWKMEKGREFWKKKKR